MLAGGALLLILIVAALRKLRKDPPLERSDLRRLERFSENLRREDSLPFV